MAILQVLPPDPALPPLVAAIQARDLPAIQALAPRVNWEQVTEEARRSRYEDIEKSLVLEGLLTLSPAERARDEEAACVRHLPFVAAALEAMVASGFALMKDPAFEWGMDHRLIGPVLIAVAVRHQLTNTEGQTVVHLALGEGNPSPTLLKIAFDHGADPNAASSDGTRPLENFWIGMRLAALGVDEDALEHLVETYRVLLEGGADETLCSSEGEPLHEMMRQALYSRGSLGFSLERYAPPFEEARASVIAARQLQALDVAVPAATAPAAPRL